jgi:hypothetical protein
LYNLNVARLSSFEDQVTPATDVSVAVRVPFAGPRTASLQTADEGASSGPLKFKSRKAGGETVVEVNVPRLDVSAILIIEG